MEQEDSFTRILCLIPDLWLCQGPMYPDRVGYWQLVSSSAYKITPRLAGVKFPSLAALGLRDSMEEGARFQRNGTTRPKGLTGRVTTGARDQWT